MMISVRLPAVSVVISTHNRRERLRRMLAPLLADRATHEVVVVVDGSRDGSYELLRSIAADDGRVKPVFVENRGETGARYEGAQLATGDVLLILDDDEVAEPGLVTGHARHHEDGEPRKVVLGYAPVGKPERRTRDNFATYVYEYHYERACREYEEDPRTVLLRLHGGHMSMRREDFLSIAEHWETAVNGYLADMDFGLRCLKAGFTGVFDRRLVAVHEYERPLAAFIADAVSEGLNRSLVHWHHRDLIGLLPPDQYERGLPAPARWVVRLGRRPRAHALIRPVLYGAVVLCGGLRLFRLQTWGAQLLRRLEQQCGAIEFERHLAAGSPPPGRLR
jgi:glycosyltransferase involved in cell wall biosynthesis